MERRLEISAARLPGWVDRFAKGHPGTTAEVEVDRLHLRAPDGARAHLNAWPGARPPAGPQSPPGGAGIGDWAELGRWAAGPDALAIVLVRRGGWSVGMASGEELVRHRTGRRYVQSRTAAGGWSQQRFARRRGNQSDALVARVATAMAELWAAAEVTPSGLVLGGDRALAAGVLEEMPELARRTLTAVPRREFYDLPDPRLVVLRTALARARSAVIDVLDPTR
ncbi:hypothetical protein LQF12_03045 [Ruania suaedae]|uniref:acVLRF1 family peptidyl-tRNA hydrolase n=1 Tax=Ruania suaedae TaxID=2897774 RepID=UPI001E285418|nr:acVLRF1 family peptidyl-tRNA hydrolase [Ruania suaedae]UFU03601.1 hypothetical protein LQF12_03045 [Ruania suaedae]